jgi:hypothetical protein
MQAATWDYCTVTLVDPLAQELPDAIDAVTVVVPVPTKVASPGVDEKLTIEVFPELHVAEFVTSTPFWLAVNCWLVVVARVNVWLAGLMVMVVVPCVPVTVTVAVPLTPATSAVMVTFVAGPTPVTTPWLTVAQGLELVHEADFVTSLEPLSNAAVACNWPVALWATERVLGLTVTEFG